MKVEDLKNYGRPLNLVTGEMPFSVRAMVLKEVFLTTIKNLGLVKTLKVFAGSVSEGRRMSDMDLSVVRNKGCSDEKFIKTLVQSAAFFSSMKNIAGMEKTIEIHEQIMDKIAIPMNKAVLPPASEIQKFKGEQGEFQAFKKYVMALWKADQQAGLHHFELVEDSEDALAVNVTYCAYCQIPKELGIMEACLPACYSDDVFFPRFLEQLGVRFVRTRTLARNGEHCDFRFEVIPEDNA